MSFNAYEVWYAVFVIIVSYRRNDLEEQLSDKGLTMTESDYSGEV